ncbi:endolytic transglycosylase MltG [Virgibacillus sp. W0181]|uniref:endolytic transglycosylase MltG n=1 Tax=Virgibacillus sp. W0181 TaxID=3391581 RepID=UPI003F47D6A6
MSNDIKKQYKNNLAARSEEAKTVRKIVAIIILSLVLIIVIGGISGYMYIKSSLAPVNPESTEEQSIEIPLGSSTSNIANILEENGIIKDGRVFRFYIKFKNESDFQAGEYTLSPALSINEIIEKLKSGKVHEEAVYTVTIPEGKTIQQIAQIYSSILPFKKDEFLDKVNDTDYINQLINEYPDFLSEKILDSNIVTPLEGYLFAATYDFYKEDPTIESVIKKMLDKTEEVVGPYLGQMEEKNLTIHEALTFASLVENEAKTQDQRTKIAGVFYNRLEKNMPLQTDPTVLYALGQHKDKVLLKDLETESPYNTYQIKDLPIGPISNFGKESLEATLQPEDTDYIYFLHDSEGNIHYAETHDEHIELKNKYIE